MDWFKVAFVRLKPAKKIILFENRVQSDADKCGSNELVQYYLICDEAVLFFDLKNIVIDISLEN